MAARKCPKCGKNNPHFFTHCVDCGARLADETPKNEKILSYLKIGFIVCLSLLFVIFVILPAVQYSHTFGRNFSESISTKSAADTQIAQYPLNSPVANNDLQITVKSARDGQNTYNSNKFFMVSVSLKNNRTSGNVQVSSSDFVLIDSEGMEYTPYGMGSKVMYDLSPSQDNNAELTYIIPQSVAGKKIRFTFPAPSAPASSREMAVFVI